MGLWSSQIFIFLILKFKDQNIFSVDFRDIN